MLNPNRSSRTFLRRLGVVPTRPAPIATMVPSGFIFNRVPLAPPLPLAETLLPAEGSPPPDRGPTRPWPPDDRLTEVANGPP